MKRTFILFISVFLLRVAGSFGQATATLEDNELLMGKTMKMEVLVPLSSDSSHVAFPALEAAKVQNKKYISLLNDTIEILTDFKKALETRGDRFSMRYDLQIQAFDSGRYEIPSLEFMMDGEKITSNPVTIEVLPVKVKADDKIDDFAEVVPPFETSPELNNIEEEEAGVLVWWIIAAVVLLILGLVSYIIYRRKGTIFMTKKVLPPYMTALSKIKKLQSQNLPARGRLKEYYTGLSEILREYLKHQFNIKTFEKTTSEILNQVEDNDGLKSYFEILKTVLTTADFVKFAKLNPSKEENARCLDLSVKFINDSHPVEEEGGDK